MTGIPEQFVQPVTSEGQKGFVPTQNPLIMRPVFGTVDSLAIRFYMDFDYNEQKTLELPFEYSDPVEMVRITVDRFTQIVGYARDLDRMIVDMKPEIRARIQELYQKFKRQDSSNETPIVAWVAAKPMEKNLCERVGIGTVEQLADASKELLAHLGPYGPDLQSRARKHVASKTERIEVGDQAKVIHDLRLELEQLRKMNDEKFERLIAAQSEKAKSEKKRGRPRKQEKEIEQNETISGIAG
jgi:hypothetical protein